MAKILNRQQLSQFLSSPEAIRAFEEVFIYVAETSPSSFDEITSALLSASRRYENLSILQRIEELEQLIKIRPNFSDILSRLDNLESVVSQRTNLSDILNKIKNIETLLGV